VSDHFCLCGSPCFAHLGSERDDLKAKLAEALALWEGELDVIARYRADAVTLLQERDEARGTARKLYGFTVAGDDRWQGVVDEHPWLKEGEP
jgi:hypothetical protein